MIIATFEMMRTFLNLANIQTALLNGKWKRELVKGGAVSEIYPLVGDYNLYFVTYWLFVYKTVCSLVPFHLMRNWTFPVIASEETGALKSLSEHQLPALVQVQTSHLETLKPWAIIHRGYCLLYSGFHQEAAKHVDQVRQKNQEITISRERKPDQP